MDVYCKNHRECVVQLYFDCKCRFAHLFSSFPQQPRYSLRSRKSLRGSEVSRVKDWCGKGLIDIRRSDPVIIRKTWTLWKVSERSESSRTFHPFLMYIALSCFVFTYAINSSVTIYKSVGLNTASENLFLFTITVNCLSDWARLTSNGQTL